VEVVAGRESGPAVVDRIFDLAGRWGKTAVRAADTPGFIVNRVARPYYLESLRILEERLASCDGLDALMKSGGGFRMGPFELMDLIGIDVNYAVTCSVYEQSGRPARFRPSPIQAQLVERGRLGRKTGVGMYRYEGGSATPAWTVEVQSAAPAPAVAAAWKDLGAAAALNLGSPQGVLFGRVVCALMNEASLAAEEGVATEADIDLAMQRGTNYPRGLLAWAAAWGHDRVGAFLVALDTAAEDDRFKPAARFRHGA
jgi:3-hydroxybutyryl-CoA dehydrogenase